VSGRGADSSVENLKRDLSHLGLRSLGAVRSCRLFFLDGRLDEDAAGRIAREVLSDPVTDAVRFAPDEVGTADIEVLYNPGVMDPSVESIVRAIAELGYADAAVRTGRGYRFGRKLSPAEKTVVSGLLMNPLIEHMAVPSEHVFVEPEPYRFSRVTVRLQGRADEELVRLSKEKLLALSAEEMRIVAGHFEKLGRDPTDVELESLAQTWSEHCQHKTFRGVIELDGRRIKNLLKSTIFRVTKELSPDWCLSVFHDNSGVIRFDDQHALTFKVETHNHPSALEPYGGAATGIGGVIRDCLGTGLGAKPILNTDVFCFAPPSMRAEDVPQGVVHPRPTMRGVVSGVRDYGNRMGIPTANGAVYFDEGFLGNPLVFCGTLGLIPVDRIAKRVRKGQAIVLLGGRTGRDGIHGVTFASLELDQESAEFSSGAVQIGNPIEEKKVADAVLAARDLALIAAITDCGGGGLSSAVGELTSVHGCEVELDRVPLKYAGLSPAEIWISEAQERMVILTSESKARKLLDLCRRHDVEATVIGKVTGTGRLVLRYAGNEVANLEMKFLHHGWRRVSRKAKWERPETAEPFVARKPDLTGTVLKLLQTPNVASKEWVVRQYDHEVQGGSVVKPFCGARSRGPTDGCVIAPKPGSYRGCVLGCGLRPRYGLVDPYRMAASAIDEALRNVVALGGDLGRTALLDNFCWGSPERPDQLAGLVRAAQACYDVAKAYRVPFISGKDSLYNEFRSAEGESFPIPPTLLVSALSVISDVRLTVTADMKRPGSYLYLVGETFEELGGSEYYRINQGLGAEVPRVDPGPGRRLMTALSRAIGNGLVRACHDLSEGGLGVALAEMCFAGGVGCRVRLDHLPGARRFTRDDFLLFSESNTRFLCEVRREHQARFESLMRNVPCAPIGRTTSDQQMVVSGLKRGEVVRLELSEAERAWRTALTKYL